MPCQPFQTADGVRGIICTGSRGRRDRCADCGGAAGLLCDYPVGKVKTCDRKICARHAHEIGPDLHYCETHWRASGMDHAHREGDCEGHAAAPGRPANRGRGGEKRA